MYTIPINTFIKNRYKLTNLLLPSSAVIISANRIFPRNGDQSYPFRQSSDLMYLSGIKQDVCTLILISGGSSFVSEEILFIPKSDERTEMWEGPRISVEEAQRISGIKDVRYDSSLYADLKDILTSVKNVYFGSEISKEKYPLPTNEAEIRRVMLDEIMALEEQDLEPLMKRVRVIKEYAEIEMMRKAIDITGIAFAEILKSLKPGMREYEIAALMSYTFLRNGSEGHAFDPIVASGENALVLHYSSNRGICKNNDLLLMDFGADWAYYAADISRTIPVNGIFGKRQKLLYEANLRVMNSAIKLMTPGKLLGEFNKEVGQLWEEEHVGLGLYSLEDIKRQDRKRPLWSKYYWHGTSHSIGIDVHDPYIHSEVLQEGMVMSCEPGIYIVEEGVGIRLENDILILETGAENLSQEIPIDVDEIESLMGHK